MFTLIDGMATVGFITSTVLAYFKIKDYIRDNRGIHVSYSISGHPEEWNIIYLTNLSAVPVVIEYWDMVWRKKRFPFKSSYEVIQMHDNEDLHQTLQPHVTETFHFKNQYELDWHPTNKGRVKLFIQLQIAGRKKPLYLFVYKPY